MKLALTLKLSAKKYNKIIKKMQEWLLWDVLWTAGYINIPSPLRENEQSPRWSKK